MNINEKTIGRRFTIEPRSGIPRVPLKSREAQRSPAEFAQKPPLNDAITGIRLFPGNILIASRKYGSFRNQLAAGLARQDLLFTVTEHGVDPELFIRVLYNCPRGIFVQTVRNDEEESPSKVVTSAHHKYSFDRAAGQSVTIRPRVNSLAAVEDLETNGVFVISWFDQDNHKVMLHVAATDAWEVMATERATTRSVIARPPQRLREDSHEFLLAFFQEAVAYLDGEEMDLLKSKASEQLNKNSNNRQK